MIFDGKLRGSARVKITGDGGNALLRRLTEAEIPLWDIGFEKGELVFSLGLSDLPDLRVMAAEQGCGVTVLRGGGLPFWWKSIKRKKASWLTAAAVFAALWCVLSVVWEADVVAEGGSELTAREEKAILLAAEKCGLAPPLFKAAIDPEEASAALLRECPDLSWVGVSPEGMTLVIRVAEKQKDPKESAVHGNVVAEKSGVIRGIFVLKGQKQAETGDTVKKGDILISGDIVYEEEGKDPVYDRVAAKGTVTAAVAYEGVAYAPLERERVTPTGKTAGIVTLAKGDRCFVLWGSEENPFAAPMIKESAFRFLGWELRSKTYGEAERQTYRVSEETALAEAEREAGLRAEKQIPQGAAVIDRRREILRDRRGMAGVKVILICEEEIGKFMNLP